MVTFERTHQPYNCEGQRTGALRFGDPRAMALAGALSCVVHAVTGFTNHSLRGLVAGLLGQDYSTNQMTYDLRRLRLHGLIRRLPHTNTYLLTPEGIRVAVFYTKLQNRLLRPLLATDHPPAPLEVRRPGDPRPRRCRSRHPCPPRSRRLKTCHKVTGSDPQEDLEDEAWGAKCPECDQTLFAGQTGGPERACKRC
ncbi:MAG: hypothetical protein ACR2G7_06350 [Acidimicrobiales bacterium]